MTEFSLSTTIDAPKERVWEVLKEFGEISKWNPGVVESHSTTDATGGIGAERRCDLGKGQWVEERIVGWEEGKSLDINIFDSNVPLSDATVTLSVESLDEGESRVDLNINYKLKYGPLGMLMDLMMGKRSYRRAMNGLLAGLKHHSETGKDVETDVPAAASA